MTAEAEETEETEESELDEAPGSSWGLTWAERAECDRFAVIVGHLVGLGFPILFAVQRANEFLEEFPGELPEIIAGPAQPEPVRRGIVVRLRDRAVGRYKKILIALADGPMDVALLARAVGAPRGSIGNKAVRDCLYAMRKAGLVKQVSPTRWSLPETKTEREDERARASN